MKKKTTLVITALFFYVLSPAAFCPIASAAETEQWEYTAVTPSFLKGSVDDLLEKANRLGAEGWELVTTGEFGRPGWIFKRKLPSGGLEAMPGDGKKP